MLSTFHPLPEVSVLPSKGITKGAGLTWEASEVKVVSVFAVVAAAVELVLSLPSHSDFALALLDGLATCGFAPGSVEPRFLMG